MPGEKQETPSVEKETKNSTGLEPNVAALLAYLFGWVSGLVFYLIEKDDKFVRFAAMQSILLSVTYFALVFIISFVTFGFGWSLTYLLGLGYFGLSIYLMVQAYNKKEVELPVIGKFAKDAVNK